MREYSKVKISHKLDIRSAVKSINETGIGFAVIVDDDDLVVGILTDGDFRRAVLKGLDLNDNVLKITNRDFRSLQSGFSQEEAICLLKSGNFTFLPVIQDGRLIGILSENDLQQPEIGALNKKLQSEVVIMAGGKGTRMEPFTKILPKPLIPIGDRTMLEVIMDEYAKYGIKDFHISVCHKAKMIKAYFEYIENGYNIHYINEDSPRGTCGALKLAEGKFNGPFFVSNCDIIIKSDYSKIFEYHQSQDFMLTIVTSIQHMVIPYGVCELNDVGGLSRINEKPKFDYLINTGMYVLNPEVLQYIPTDTFFDITDLIKKLLDLNLKVGVYPVPEQSYVDVGQWAEYKKAINILTV
ncbi:sugar phosphate nucleotidyltransferase [Geobacter sp. DSM 9736]|uniref:sugar phosphate nucleotidyltransferase n=1 Tax=Geobacter sp. DSM 9736 TaxID=1277350 RepID=UPI000B5E244A|nr:sugar phosphate nucleotidyltransferase [Geobacter sp. DSM 9736]SNB45042.1 CBS domain-containing protein [Geobacter sp. DSM 9736]